MASGAGGAGPFQAAFVGFNLVWFDFVGFDLEKNTVSGEHTETLNTHQSVCMGVQTASRDILVPNVGWVCLFVFKR